MSKIVSISNYHDIFDFPELSKVFQLETANSKTKVRRENDSYVISVELPGCELDDIKLTISNDILTLSAIRKYKTVEDSHTYNYSWKVPSDKYNQDEISTTYKDGLLNITIPFAEKQKVKEIPINLISNV
jgi:HSP20 family protein